MKPRSSKLSLYAVLTLLIASLVVLVVLRQQANVNASSEGSQLIAHSVPFKVGDNKITSVRPLDLSQRIIGLNGSLITIKQAKQRGIIDGVFDENGNELNEMHLLSTNASFIIKVRDISSSPALFF